MLLEYAKELPVLKASHRKKNIPEIVNYSSVERSFTATCACFILFIWRGMLFGFKLLLKDLFESITTEVYVLIPQIARTIIPGKVKIKFSPFHMIMS